MAADDDPEADGPVGPQPLPPDDRLWRHPSEVAAGLAPPSAWSASRPPDARRRLMMVSALLSASLAGATVAFGAMWMTRPTRVVVREATATSVVAATSVAFAPGVLPTEALARRLAPSLSAVRAAHQGTWTSGTGVWLDDAGNLMVADELVSGSDEIVVTGTDGIARPALLVGSDPATGVATVRAGRTSGTPLVRQLGQARAGEPVAVLGAASPESAAQRGPTVLTATVSAPNARVVMGTQVLHDEISLDQALPEESLGSIVMDADGDVVGLTVGSASPGDHTVVTPAAEALAAADDLSDDGRVERAWLGVRAVDLDPALASKLEIGGGAALTEVQEGSPAAGAGLRPGDVITAIDGDAVDNASDLVVSLRHHHPGDTVQIERQRAGSEVRVTVVLGG